MGRDWRLHSSNDVISIIQRKDHDALESLSMRDVKKGELIRFAEGNFVRVGS